MSHYENKIDPIGEAFENEPIETTILGKLHEDTINKNTYINNLKKEVDNLDDLVKRYQTFGYNLYMVKNLTNLSQRMKNDLKALELACYGLSDYIETTIK